MKSVAVILLLGLCLPVGALDAAECRRTEVLRLKNSASSSGTVSLWKLQRPQETAFFFRSGMSIDADGAPNAYHPVSDQGLDALGNAGKPGNWWALVTDTGRPSGTPVVQKAIDPAPGFYISTTALEDTTKARTDPQRYVDSSAIPYIVLPPEALTTLKAKMGDFAVVLNSKNHRLSPSIVADQGPKGQIGEGSIALAEALDIPSNPRHGGAASGVLYLVFPGSGTGKPRPLEQITAEATRLFDAWGGAAQVSACFP
jgi:glycosyl hydrolase group 75 (putative chitosanase)